MLTDEQRHLLVGAYIKGYMDEMLGVPVRFDHTMPESSADRLGPVHTNS